MTYVSHCTLNGFVDYTFCFPESSVTWTIVGSIIVIGSSISIIPQMVNIVKNKTSFGLNPLTIFVSSFSQFILVTNVVSLHDFDFVGFLQFPFARVIPRFLTFMVTFVLWYFYLVIPFLNMIFLDLKLRMKRDNEQIRREKFFARFTAVFLPISASIFILIFLIMGTSKGFNSVLVQGYGGMCGTIATIIGFAQYIPQMITTIKFEDPGSLSLLLLFIQAPGGVANALFMWIGQGDHWTTWISILSASIQQFILIFIILFFKVKKWRIRKMQADYKSFHQDEDSVPSISNKQLLKSSHFANSDQPFT